MFGFQLSDLRPALLRGAVLFGALAVAISIPLARSGQPVPTPFLFAVLANLGGFGSLVAVLALVERRAGRSTSRVSGGFQVLLAGLVLAPFLMLQVSFMSIVAFQGSIEVALSQTWESFRTLATQMPWELTKGCFLLALPWSIVSAARLQRATNPTLAAIGLTALLASPVLLIEARLWGYLIGSVFAAHVLFRIADLIEWLLVRRALSDELKTLKARDLRPGQLWLLAAVGDPAAKLLLGRDAPDEQPTLAGWMRQLVTGGTDVLLQAVAATARLTQAWAPEHAPAFAALDAWATAPGPGTVAQAEQALARLPDRPRHPAEIAVREALTAVTATGAWAPETVRRAAARVAEQAAELNDLAAVRGTIASVIRERIGLAAPAPVVVGLAP